MSILTKSNQRVAPLQASAAAILPPPRHPPLSRISLTIVSKISVLVERMIDATASTFAALEATLRHHWSPSPRQKLCKIAHTARAIKAKRVVV
jgi:hypothetical protein